MESYINFEGESSRRKYSREISSRKGKMAEKLPIALGALESSGHQTLLNGERQRWRHDW